MADHAANSGFVQLNDAQYDVLRRFVQLIIPGLGTLYAGLALLWHWGFIAEVTGSATLLATFGGLILKFARDGYVPDPGTPPGGFDGEIVQGDGAPGSPVLQFKLDPAKVQDVLNKPVVTFKGFDPSA
jgi:Putative phage holin Dp-1